MRVDEVVIDNVQGLGAVPNNREVDYFGLRVLMRPATFLKLAAPAGEMRSADHIEQHIKQGGAIGAPFLIIEIPPEWEDGDLSDPAKVVGHEGRNRMVAVERNDGNHPIETHLFFRHELRNRHITPEWIQAMNILLLPERSQSPFRGPYFTVTNQ